jgi:hypothetical protein
VDMGSLLVDASRRDDRFVAAELEGGQSTVPAGEAVRSELYAEGEDNIYAFLCELPKSGNSGRGSGWGPGNLSRRIRRGEHD